MTSYSDKAKRFFLCWWSIPLTAFIVGVIGSIIWILFHFPPKGLVVNGYLVFWFRRVFLLAEFVLLAPYIAYQIYLSIRKEYDKQGFSGFAIIGLLSCYVAFLVASEFSLVFWPLASKPFDVKFSEDRNTSFILGYGWIFQDVTYRVYTASNPKCSLFWEFNDLTVADFPETGVLPKLLLPNDSMYLTVRQGSHETLFNLQTNKEVLTTE